MKKLVFVFFVLGPIALFAQLAPLTVDKIMRDQVQWIGTSPSNINWSEDSKTIYFNWNPDKNKGDSLYSVALGSTTINKVQPNMRRGLPSNFGQYNRAKTQKLFERNGDIFILDIKTNTIRQLTNTIEREANPVFNQTENEVLFLRNNNLFSIQLSNGQLKQLSNFVAGRKRTDPRVSEQDKWLNDDQLNEFEILRLRKENRDAAEKARANELVKRPLEIYLEDKNVDNIRLSPDGNYITYRLTKNPEGNKNTITPNYVTESGYTENIATRTKVGNALPSYEFWVYDRVKDTTLAFSTKDLPGIYDLPDYLNDYPDRKAEAEKKKAERKIQWHGPFYSPDGKNSVMVLRSLDNKDRWIMKVDVATRQLTLLDRQRDEAWVAGPGIGGGFFGVGTLDWINNTTIYFHSEADGFSHLYSVDVNSGTKRQLTSGKFEVQSSQLSNDKKFFYFTSNEVHPGEQHFYRMSVNGGARTRLTSMKGASEVTLSPDEKYLAIRYSYITQPWELYLQEAKPGAKATKITNSISEEFKSYPWREAEVISFNNRNGKEVYARIYEPEPSKKNGAAVIFVHGAGYLQNAHYWWSSYSREYMFHNLLTDLGYTVLDIDFQASAGYGRDTRTNIYRHMGGQDLSDQVDGAKLLVEKYGVDAGRIGLYGGSYGGFITLMAMFNEPDVFKAGAALRSVTDWAHYNHGYTSNILNTPVEDPIAYKRSSPIYFPQGLKGDLLICHGMIDVNVHFQDVVRLAQRLIELGKDNWEFAVYPLEDHGFVEPSSWADEYKRILKLFETSLKK